MTGEENLTQFESSPGHFKFFCRTCGSPIMSKASSRPESVRIRLGTVESEITERPMAHIFSTSKASWEEISDDLPQYPSYEPGR